jgi:uncharacterized protein (TIGR00645 family)
MQSNKVVKRIEKTVFAVRWMLMPLYAGLVVALGLYIAHFIHEVVDMCDNFLYNYSQQNVLMLFCLELVDMVLISQLIVMTIQGGFSIFVKEFDYTLTGRPRWLNASFGSSEQKIKLGMSIMGIMVVHFLKDFIESKPLQTELMNQQVILLVCVTGATLAFCLFNILMHLPMLSHHDPEPVHTSENDHDTAHK